MVHVQNKNFSKIKKHKYSIDNIIRDFKINKNAYFLILPVLAYYFIFHYGPLYGLIIAFKDFSPGLGMFKSSWVGLQHFQDFLNSYYFWRLVKNTIVINIYQLIFGFPAPIIFALLLNEIRKDAFKNIAQTVTYLPHFISVVVICGIISEFTSRNGLINDIIALFGGKRTNLLVNPSLFRTIFVSSNIWGQMGWESIVYLAALTGININQYEAAKIDGAGRWKQALHVTIPGILPTVIILLILKIGHMMSIGWEKIILLYNPLTYETADVISTFIYRKGLTELDYSYSTAIGLFNSIINFSLLIIANKISRKVNETSLW